MGFEKRAAQVGFEKELLRWDLKKRAAQVGFEKELLRWDLKKSCSGGI